MGKNLPSLQGEEDDLHEFYPSRLRAIRDEGEMTYYLLLDIF
jgi:hypothetical protein